VPGTFLAYCVEDDGHADISVEAIATLGKRAGFELGHGETDVDGAQDVDDTYGRQNRQT